jgi:hypothetical protein
MFLYKQLQSRAVPCQQQGLAFAAALLLVIKFRNFMIWPCAACFVIGYRIALWRSW